MTDPTAPEYDLAADQVSERPATRLCTLILAEALLSKSTAVRLEAGQEDRVNVDYDRGAGWETVMQLPRPAYQTIFGRFCQMAGIQGSVGDNGQIPVRHQDTQRTLSLRVEAGAEPRILIEGFA